MTACCTWTLWTCKHMTGFIFRCWTWEQEVQALYPMIWTWSVIQGTRSTVKLFWGNFSTKIQLVHAPSVLSLWHSPLHQYSCIQIIFLYLCLIDEWRRYKHKNFRDFSSNASFCSMLCRTVKWASWVNSVKMKWNIGEQRVNIGLPHLLHLWRTLTMQ